MARIYIAGKVTGLKLAELTFKFGGAEKKLMDEGWEVINPLNIVLDKEISWQGAMKLCLKELINCEAIYMLHDWQESKGAIIEYNLAKVLNIQIYYSTPPTSAIKDEPKWD
ncbi:MAG: DUF4406 domain-containing protein [Bacteroidetes bacterium]|nr:DUF4406 domain-containing protein [Bacteroidota bacterium]